MVRRGRSGPNEAFACSDARDGYFRFEQTRGEYCAGLKDAPTSRHRAFPSRLTARAIDCFFEAYQPNLKKQVSDWSTISDNLIPDNLSSKITNKSRQLNFRFLKKVTIKLEN